MNDKLIIPLFGDTDEPQNYDVYVYGSSDPVNMIRDTFSAALKRYISELNVGNNQLARITGISQSSIHCYLNDKRSIGYEYLSAICIVLRLHPSRQRHLFDLAHCAMPDDKRMEKPRGVIIRSFLDSCAYIDKYTLVLCNKRLKSIGARPVTSLTSDVEGC